MPELGFWLKFRLIASSTSEELRCGAILFPEHQRACLSNAGRPSSTEGVVPQYHFLCQSCKKLFSKTAGAAKSGGATGPGGGVAEFPPLMEMSRPAEAEERFREALKRTPGRPMAIYGIARAAELKGNEPTARQRYQEFLTIWKNADPNRPELVIAKNFLAKAPSN